MSERQPISYPEHGHPEMAADIAFINQHLETFWHLSRLGYEQAGRGILVADATLHQKADALNRMHSFAYQPMEQVVNLFDADVQRMVRLYDPAWEFVTVLFKGDHEDAYHMRVLFTSPS